MGVNPKKLPSISANIKNAVPQSFRAILTYINDIHETMHIKAHFYKSYPDIASHFSLQFYLI